MKKIISVLTVAAVSCAAYAQDGKFPLDSLTNPSVSSLSVSASVGFESEYVFRAVKCAGYSIQPKVEVAYPIVGFDVYAGTWANTPLEGDKGGLTEVDIYGGAAYTYGAFRLDAGYIYYWYPAVDTAGDLTRDMEVYGGVSVDTASYLGGININPSVYYYYSWILKQQVVEASFGYDTPVGDWLFKSEKLTLPVRIYGGYLSAGQYNGDMSPDEEGATYWYYGASVDVAYAITEYCTVSAGIRYSQFDGNSEQIAAVTPIGPQKNFWYGVKVDFGF